MKLIPIKDTDDAIVYVNPQHIAYIEEFKDYTKIELVTGRVIATRQRFVSIEALLNS
jgi:uncharacterized protein YlzI (FlbEa/FlbD family)